MAGEIKKFTGEIKNAKKNIEAFLDSDSGCAKATKIILAVLAVSGALVVGAIAPNIFQIFGKYRRAKNCSLEQLRKGVYSLQRQGYVEIIKEGDDKIKIQLTSKGKTRIKEFSIENLSIAKPKKWDKKWRLVIFDIPNKFTKAREALRKKIKELGFYQLQKSVWIYPYPCEDEILFIANIFQVELFIEFFSADELLNENKVRKFFGLQ